MSEVDIYMGIDCGLDGAIVCLSSEGIVDMIDMPTKKQDGKRSIDIEKLAELIKKIYYEVRVCRSYQPGGHRFNKANPDVILENFHITIEDPGPHAPSAAGLRSMTYSLAVVEALLVAFNFKYNLVMARKWQKEFFSKPKGMTDKFDTKAAALSAADKIFPGTDWTRTPRSSKPFDGFVDAALIAEYARRKRIESLTTE